MSNQAPTPASPAEVCERLNELLTIIEDENDRLTVTSALLLLEQGEKERERLKRKAEYFAYLIGTGRCPVITKWDGMERHGYVSCIGVSAKAFEHALELAAQKLTDIAARAQPTPESK